MFLWVLAQVRVPCRGSDVVGSGAGRQRAVLPEMSSPTWHRHWPVLLTLTVPAQRVSVGIPYTCGRHCHPPQFNPIRTNPLERGWWVEMRGWQRERGERKTRREKELKQTERREAALFSNKVKGGRMTERKRKETKTEKETETQRSRLYLGTPRCGGLVWTLSGRGEAGLGTSHRGDPMPVPLWHSTKSLCTQCLWAGLDTSGYSQRQSTAQCGSLQRQSRSEFMCKLNFLFLFPN